MHVGVFLKVYMFVNENIDSFSKEVDNNCKATYDGTGKVQNVK